MYKQRNYINAKERVFLLSLFKEMRQKYEKRYENLSCV